MSGWPSELPDAAPADAEQSPARRKPVRQKLDTTLHCRQALARLWREARGGVIDVSDASKLAHMLSLLSRMISDGAVEQLAERLDALEARF